MKEKALDLRRVNFTCQLDHGITRPDVRRHSKVNSLRLTVLEPGHLFSRLQTWTQMETYSISSLGSQAFDSD